MSASPESSAAAFHNGSRGRFNAWFFDTFDRYINYAARQHKERAFAGIEPGLIVELGAGTGANFDYIPSGSRLIAVEPNRAMHERLLRNATHRGICFELAPASAEDIPLLADSVDTVIASLLLCTVDRPEQVLQEVLRILRPGGTFRFVEHIAAHETSMRRWVQERVRRPWAWLFEGCHTHRETASLLESAGFTDLSLHSQTFHRSLFYPVNSAIWGIAAKG